MTDQDDPVETPLDPATERVRRKMVRLLSVSIGIMFIGVMAVLAAVVYRTAGTPAELQEGASVPLALPAGVEIVDTDLDGDRLAIRVRSADGSQELFVVSRVSGVVLSRHPLMLP